LSATQAASDDVLKRPAVLSGRHVSQALRKCLTALSPDHREIVDLVYYHEKSVEEVAESSAYPRTQ
jgi:RNA polymerase sigma-70 factor (ECF subfamily)